MEFAPLPVCAGLPCLSPCRTLALMLESLLTAWHDAFGPARPQVIVRAPGRVNIIGEHTDYNEGWVMPGAMDRSLYVLMSPSNDGHRWIAHDLGEEAGAADFFSLVDRFPWTKYVAGTLRLYAPSTGPLHVLIGGDLPVGAGISSSSALVCGLLLGLQALREGQESREEIANISSRVEKEIIGLQGGIMDQYAIMLSEAEHVMMLDCRSRQYTFIPADLPGCRWVLLNTKVKHHLIDSDYNQRSAQCRESVAFIRQRYPEVQSLRDVTVAMLDDVQLPAVLDKRSRFVLAENDRVHAMREALERHDAYSAGTLLNASHIGLRDEYEVSCAELDFLAAFAHGDDRVHGARMMGGGFGGCVIALLKEATAEAFTGDASRAYEKTFGFAPEVIFFALGEGAREV